ncbi:hypothetical protein QFC19_004277 [Naganishia cerealis]|uniref:Uncharacterized protein n=1 Tax=Naganishia cerealis TaxID=610337 RepID=A0ACC2VVN3_9TREE|nr:hypothetical protein QFC19_004277 [Naganishia cerealis]
MQLVTNLDDNMICYLHMYGLRTGTREIGDGYMFGFFDEKTNTVVPLVKTIKNTEQVIGQKQDFQALTSNNTHAPKYDPEVDYCAQVEKLLEIANVVRNVTMMNMGRFVFGTQQDRREEELVITA